MSDSSKPYVGPRPFQAGEGNLFHGREEEASALLSLIIAHPAVLLYAQSGAGKTSLLNAKVKPLLEERSAEVLGPSRVSGQLPADVTKGDVANIFVFNGLLSLQEDSACARNFDGQTTISDYLKALPRQKGPAGGPAHRVLMFDQFEEIFTTSQERWTDRDGFFDQLGAALEADPLMRVVFAMREEYLASMDNHVSTLPERLRTRFHLERLRYDAALLAVTKPLAGTERHFAPGVAEQLVKNLLRVSIRSETGLHDVPGEFVEPVQLQVVCQNIWEALKDDVVEIDEQFVENWGDVDKALTTYYEDCLSQVVNTHDIKEAVLRRWFDTKLITPDGLRGMVYQEDEETGTLPNNIVSMLEELRLVRAETRAGARWFELTHDRLVAPIRNSNRTWFAQQQGALIGRLLEAKAKEWNVDQRDEKLLKGEELDDAMRWLQNPEAVEFGASDSLKVYVQGSKTAAARRRAGILRRQVGALVLLLLIAIGVAVWIFFEKRRADEAGLLERGDVANTMVERGKIHDGLAWALKASEPGLRNSGSPPLQSTEILRKVLRVIGGTIWQRSFPTGVTVQFSPDGSLILTHEKDKAEIALWNSRTGQQVFSGKTESSETEEAKKEDVSSSKKDIKPILTEVNFSPGGHSLIIQKAFRAAEESSSKIFARHRLETQVWDLKGKPRQVFSDLIKANDMLQFSRDDTTALVESTGKQIRLVDAESGQTKFSIDGAGEKIAAIVLSPLGSHLVQCNSNGTLVFRKLIGGVESTRVTRSGAIKSTKRLEIKFSFDGKVVAVLQDNSWEGDKVKSNLSIWETETGNKLGEVLADSEVFDKLHFRILPGNTQVLMVNGWGLTELSEINNARVWNLNSNTIFPLKQKVVAIDESRGPFLLTLSDQKAPMSCRVLDPVSEKPLAEFTQIPEGVELVLSGDFNTAATLDKNNLLQVWQAGDFTAAVNNMSPQELYVTACKKLQYQEAEFSPVKALCQPWLK